MSLFLGNLKQGVGIALLHPDQKEVIEIHDLRFEAEAVKAAIHHENCRGFNRCNAFDCTGSFIFLRQLLNTYI